MFKYKVFDNFLINEDFQEVSKLNLGEISDNGKRVFHNRIYKNGKIEVHALAKKLLKECMINIFQKL